MAKKPTAVLITGPTASGKSALALRLAQTTKAFVINADAMQMYKELRILTARPSLAEEAVCPHRLYGSVAGHEPYHVARFLDEADAVLHEAKSAARVPVIVGGTGLYLHALGHGISAIPPIDPTVRRTLRRQAETQGIPALYAKLRTVDAPWALQIHPSDTQRILRGLEVALSTGRPLSAWHTESSVSHLAAWNVVSVVLMPPRDDLYARCHTRFKTMLSHGACEEVAALCEKAYDPDLPVMKALGVRPLMEHIKGNKTLAQAIEETDQATRHYVRRQTTWFRKYMRDWLWLEKEHSEKIYDKVFHILQKNLTK